MVIVLGPLHNGLGVGVGAGTVDTTSPALVEAVDVMIGDTFDSDWAEAGNTDVTCEPPAITAGKSRLGPNGMNQL